MRVIEAPRLDEVLKLFTKNKAVALTRANATNVSIKVNPG